MAGRGFGGVVRAAMSARASVAYLMSCLVRNGPKEKRVVPPYCGGADGVVGEGAQWRPGRVRMP